MRGSIVISIPAFVYIPVILGIPYFVFLWLWDDRKRRKQAREADSEVNS